MNRKEKTNVLFDYELFQVAYRNLRMQKTRSILTLLGIIIGIAAIVALVSLGEGLHQSVTSEFESLGTDTVVVLPGAGFAETIFAELEDDDADTIEQVRGVDFAAEIFIEQKQIEFDGEIKSTIIIGLDTSKMENLGTIGLVEIGEGRNLSTEDHSGVLVGGSFARKGFEDKEMKLRQAFTLGDYKLRIIGITATTSHSFGSMFNSAILMNSEMLETISAEQLAPDRIFVKLHEGSDVAEVSERIETKLEKKHGEVNFQVIQMEQITEIAGSILGIIQLVLLGIASLALLVGGIGIMNTMLMAVMERTKEIGIMKAIGATNRRILAIFIMEAGLIGVVGGIIGLLFGAGISFGISAVATAAGFELPAIVSIQTVAFAILFSMLVGMISGVIPAMRAAKMDPVEALAFE